MAEAFLQILLDNLTSFIQGELGLLFGFKAEFEKIKSTFTTIQAVLEDAQEKQLKDKQLENWLQKLNVAAYEVDDILVECKTKAARLNQTKYGCYHPKVITFRHKVGKRMKEMMEKLDAIAAERSKFHLEKRTIEREAARRETGFVSTEQKVYGRDKEEDEIVKILINNISDTQELSVLPILGMGRLGKTTLAQMVFNDRRVTEHFHFKLWICVSDDFDEKKLIKAIAESIEGRPLGDMGLAPLQKKLQDLLTGKRYFLALDDVWNDDQENWDDLKAVLMVGASGTSVLTTTRLEKVGSIMGTLQPYQLSNMSQEDCCQDSWRYFVLQERRKRMGTLFPKDTEMENEKLISLWMAHGFLSSKGNLVLEDVGNEVWNELYLRSFFQEIKVKSGNAYFKVHDLIHDLAASLFSASASSNNIREINAKSYTHRMSIGFAEVVSSYSPSLLKRLSTWGTTKPESLWLNSIKHLERVKNDKDAKEANLSAKGNLHSLIMSWDKYEPHRYESEEAKGKVVSIVIEGCENCSCLPPFGELPFLESLVLHKESAEYVEEDDVHYGFPTRRRLPSLRKLIIDQFDNLKGLLKKEGEEKFPVLEEINIYGCPMFVFPTLSSVKKLVIHKEADATGFRSISNLTTLTSLYMYTNYEATSVPEEMFKSLANLKYLKISYYYNLKEESLRGRPGRFNFTQGVISPEMQDTKMFTRGIAAPNTPHNLRTLDLYNCRSLSCLPKQTSKLGKLPPFGELTCLESLELWKGLQREVEYVETEDIDVHSRFPTRMSFHL
ncbi:hypothetical protein KY290_035361 [Solanum tuberosum]|uniref:Uncharacterized protein n=1 Tax=Solanum tuberosum TaxID=4113 RepID=A0ABQ7U6F2_SOLTU|nr:hypothetical protein KY284_034638 [Solanum tuberosum]KAH0742318.1 hypothetical protein KY290_035361 [Solanum tuberosum]